MTRKLVWNTIAIPVGKMSGHPAGEFTLDQKCFEEIVRNHAEDGIDLPADFFHAVEKDSAAKDRGDFVPSGWIKSLKIENGNLLALVDWSDKGRAAIINRDLRFLSPAIKFNSKHPQTGADRGAVLSSIALCAKPFLRSLPEARAMSDQDEAIQMSEVAIGAAALAELSDDEPEEMIFMTEHTTLLADGIAQATEAITVELHDTRVERDVAAAQLAALTAQVKLLTDAANEARVEEAFQMYQSTRKLGASARKAMKLIQASDPALFDAEYPRLPNAPGYMMRKLADDPGNVATLAGVKTVPEFSVILSDARAQNPALEFDRVFDIALAQQATMMGAAA